MTDTAPIYDPTEGHYYELITSPLNYTEAHAAASRRTHNGLDGHLATITFQEEYTFVVAAFKNLSFAWIGATDVDSEGVFLWDAGPDSGGLVDASQISSFWEKNQPDDSGGNEDCVHFGSSNRFRDANCAQAKAYLIEYEGMRGLRMFAILLWTCLYLFLINISLCKYE